MGHPGLDPETALQLFRTLLYCIACILGGSVLLGLSAYIVFLCLEVFSPQPSSKGRLAKLPHLLGGAQVAEENLDLLVGDMPILAKAESLDGGAVPALAPDTGGQVLANSSTVISGWEPNRIGKPMVPMLPFTRT